MCYGGAVRSAYARARVLAIDTSAAEALEGVICVLTQKDIPGKINVGHLKKDQPTLIGVGEITHYLGDTVALVCARDQETLEAAKKLVQVEYEVLPVVHSPAEAAAPGAPLVFETDENNVQAYKHVSRGDAAGAIARSKYVLTEHFHTPWTEHAFLEPECCVALPLENGGVRLLTRPCTSAPRCWASTMSTVRYRICSSAAASAARRTCPCSTTRRCWHMSRAFR